MYDLNAIMFEVNKSVTNDASYHVDTISRFKVDIIDVVLSYHDKDLMYVLSKDKTISLCTIKGVLLKTIVLEQNPVCLAIDSIDNKIVIGCESGEICFVSFTDGSNAEDEGFLKPSQNTIVSAPLLTTKKNDIKNSTAHTSIIQIHSKKVNTICYVPEDQRFVSTGDDCCIYSFNNEGKVISAVKNLKTPYYYLIPIDRQLLQENTTGVYKKSKLRAKVFKSFTKIINKNEVHSEVIAFNRVKKIKKPVFNKTVNIKTLINYMQYNKPVNMDGDHDSKQAVDSDELKKMKAENEKLKAINAKLLEVCTLLEDKP